jgi:Skp family chaperone for outer membrane proteins
VFSRVSFATAADAGGNQKFFNFVWTLQTLMLTEANNASPSSGLARIGAQPIALTAAALFLIVAGAASIAIWRAYTGHSPETTDRALVARALQARATQVSEQLFQTTKGLEQTQQESIDQLQVMQDQLQTVRRQLAAQQAENKRLSEQVAGLNEAVDGLRQSFASTQANEPAPAARHRAYRTREHAVRTSHRRAKSRS